MKAQPCKYCENPVAHNASRCPRCGGKHPYPGLLLQLQRQQQSKSADPANDGNADATNLTTKNRGLGCVVVLAIVAVSVALIPSKNQSTTKSSPQSRSNANSIYSGVPSKFEAWHQACDLVREVLKSPSSAKFPSSSDPNISILLVETVDDPDGGTTKFYSYAVSGFVDSNNSLGTSTRTRFKVTLWTDGSRWLPVDDVELW